MNQISYNPAEVFAVPNYIVYINLLTSRIP